MLKSKEMQKRGSFLKRLHADRRLIRTALCRSTKRSTAKLAVQTCKDTLFAMMAPLVATLKNPKHRRNGLSHTHIVQRRTSSPCLLPVDASIGKKSHPEAIEKSSLEFLHDSGQHPPRTPDRREAPHKIERYRSAKSALSLESWTQKHKKYQKVL